MEEGQTEKVKKAKYQKKGGNGGARDGSGRKTSKVKVKARGLQEIIDKHFGEEVKIQIVDPKTGTVLIVTKPRVLRMLEVLYDQAVGGNYESANKWLDRALGKAKQSVSIEGKMEFDPEDIERSNDILRKILKDGGGIK